MEFKGEYAIIGCVSEFSAIKKMKQHLKLFLILFFICFFSNIIWSQHDFIQKPVIGLSLGSEFLTQKLPKTNLSSSFGIFGQFQLSKYIFLGTTLTFANRYYYQKHINYFSTGNFYVSERKEKEGGVTLALNIKYRLNDGNFQYFIGLGLLQRWVAKNTIFSYEDLNGGPSPTVNYFLSNDKRGLAGFNINSGFDFKVSDKIFFSAQIGLHLFPVRNSSALNVSTSSKKSNMYLNIRVGQFL